MNSFRKRTIEFEKKSDNNFFNVGLWLIGLKANVPHGEFLQNLQERDIPERTARNYMKVANEFHSLNKDFCIELGSAKMYALLKATDQDKKMLLEKQETSFASQKELLTLPVRIIKKRIKESKGEETELNTQSETQFPPAPEPEPPTAQEILEGLELDGILRKHLYNLYLLTHATLNLRLQPSANTLVRPVIAALKELYKI